MWQICNVYNERDKHRAWKLREYLGLGEYSGGSRYDIYDERDGRVAQHLKANIGLMSGKEFEVLCWILLERVGYVDVSLTRYSKDKGVDAWFYDVLPTGQRLKFGAQVKRRGQKTTPNTIGALRGRVGIHNRAMVISSNGFRPEAEEAACPDERPVHLIGGQQLIGLMLQHEIGYARLPNGSVRVDDWNDWLAHYYSTVPLKTLVRHIVYRSRAKDGKAEYDSGRLMYHTACWELRRRISGRCVIAANEEGAEVIDLLDHSMSGGATVDFMYTPEAQGLTSMRNLGFCWSVGKLCDALVVMADAAIRAASGRPASGCSTCATTTEASSWT